MKRFKTCGDTQMSLCSNSITDASIEILSLDAKAEDNKNVLIESFDLKDFNHWRTGRYEAGKYSLSTSMICTKEYLICNADTAYSVSISNDEYTMIITELDSDGNYIHSKELRNAGEFVTNQRTVGVGITLYTPKSYKIGYSDYEKLFQSGLTLDVTRIINYSTDISKTNLSNFGLWRSGKYNYKTADYELTTSSICLYDLKTCKSKAVYKIQIPDEQYRLLIRELDANGGFLTTSELKNGDQLITTDYTNQLAVSLYHPNNYAITFSDYSEVFKTGFAISITLESVIGPIMTTENLEEIKSIGNDGSWISGGFNDVGETEEDANSIRLNTYYKVDISNLQIHINHNYLLTIKEYSQEYEYIKSTNLVHGDYITLNATTTFITISVSGGEQLIDQLETDFLLTIDTIELLDDIKDKKAEFGGALNIDSLSNGANYREGWYYSWGGYYAPSSATLCTRNLYAIENKIQVVNVNDSRITLSIQEYDGTGKWLKYVDSCINGTSWKPQPQTAYITITLRTSVWGIKLNTLLAYGLKVYFANDLKETGTTKIPFDGFNLSNFSNWRAGEYSAKSGEFGISEYNLCTKYFLDVRNDTKTYMVDNGSSYILMNILEFDQNGNVMKSSALQSGKKWAKDAATAYIGIYLSSANKFGYNDYKQLFLTDHKPSLNEFIRYQYNTIMKDITADTFFAAMNVGWNLGNSLDAHYGDRTGTGVFGQETTWGNIVITKELIDSIRKLGFNTIRIPVTWYYNTYTDDIGHLHIYKQWLERVQDVVDYAIANGLYVILNTHHEQPIIYAGTDDTKMKQVLSDAKDLWNEIATYFKDYDEHLIFEAYNEVDNVAKSWNYSDQAADQMNMLNQVFVDVVRGSGGNNKKRLLSVPTLLDGHSSSFLSHFVLPKDSVKHKLIVQVHDYGMQFDQDIEPLFIRLETFSKKISAPVIIGEFGTKSNYIPAEYRRNHAANYIARAKAHDIKCIYWDDGNLNNFGLVNRREFSSSQQDILKALVNPVAYKMTNKKVFNNMDPFVWKTLNQSTGELAEDKWWGTIVTDSAGKGLTIQEGTDYVTVALEANDDAESLRIHYVHFYDVRHKLIKAYNDSAGTLGKTYVLPEGATFIRMGINDSYHATTEAKYNSYFQKGDLVFTYGFLDKEDINSLIEVQL